MSTFMTLNCFLLKRFVNEKFTEIASIGLHSLEKHVRYSEIIGAWRSLVAHLLWEQGVGGSNPLAPTIQFIIHSSQL